jgi:hypothetical protein
MIERIIENWLNNTDERGYQHAFCQLLSSQGHKIIQRPRHGPFEQGKDIVTISADGVPHAYQLKARDISLGRFRSEVLPELSALYLPIKHPSIDGKKPHKSFLVTNGVLSPEARVEIVDHNRVRERGAKESLVVYEHGWLVSEFVAAHGEYLPQEIDDIKTLLSLYVQDGKNPFSKEGCSQFLMNILPFGRDALSGNEYKRAASSTTILANYILEPFRQANNHWAQVEGWSLVGAHLLALAIKAGLGSEWWKDSFEIVQDAAIDALYALFDETKGKKFLLEGGLFDGLFYKYRTTAVLGYICTLLIGKYLRGESLDCLKDVLDLIDNYKRHLVLWGEAALPLMMAVYWVLRIAGRKAESNEFLEKLLWLYVAQNVRDGDGIIGPYYDAEAVLRHELGLADGEIEECFHGHSYGLEGLVAVATRADMRKELVELWRPISHITYLEFVPENGWEIFLWKVPKGHLSERFPNQLQRWGELRETAMDVNRSQINEPFVSNPDFLLQFLLAYPHRFSPLFAKYLDSLIR